MKKTFRFIIIILALGMMSYSGYKLLDIYSEYEEGDKLYDDFAKEFFNISEAAKVENEDFKKTGNESSYSVDFDSLLAENKDVVGWIYSEGTPINYPIVQSKDNDYYLRRMLDGSYNIAGSIFMDYRNSPDFTDLNTIIFGHNMRNDSMFSSLRDYDSQEYYEEHPVIHIITPEESYEVQLLSGFVTDIRSDIYNFPQTVEEQKILVEKIMKKSTFESKESFNEGDRLIILSTCSVEDKDSRYILVGKIV